MKRRFTILTAALALLMTFAIPMGMKGQKTHTIGWGTATGGAGTYTNFTATSGVVEGVISFETAKNDAQTVPAYNANYSDLRLYYASNGEGGSITIRPASTVTITNAVITTSTSPSVAYYVDGGDAVNITATNNIYTISEISATSALTIQNVNTTNTQLRIKTIALTYTTSDSQPTCTVTFDAGEGTFVANNDFPNESNAVETGTYILPSATRDGYTFNGWALGEDTYEGGTTYMVNADVDFVASYTENGGESETATATLTQSNLELTGSYSSNNSKTIDGITYVHTDLMKNSTNIQAKASTGTIKNTTAYPGDIISVAITHSGTGRATTINGSVDGTNWNQVATGNGSITADFSGKGYKYFQITRGSNAAYWEKIEILYSTTSSSLNQSDLAISSPTADLSFDLYNNPTAQVITYTTSSTGAITITPTESIYFSYVHDATAKTITVTPLAVTPDAQTITIDQEADDSYYGGTAAFTVSVVNSDPNLPGTENNPYTVAQARAAIDAGTGTQGVYATGIVSAIQTEWSTQYNNITFNFVDNDGDNNFLQAYRCASGTGVDASQVAVGDEVVVYGNLIKFGSTYEFDQGCQLVSLTHPSVPSITVTPATLNVDAQEHLVNYLDLAYENIDVENGSSFTIHYYNAEAEEIQVVPGEAWMIAGVVKPNDVYQVLCVIVANEGEARTAYFKLSALDAENNTVYSNLVTVNQAMEDVPPTPGEWVMVSLNDLTEDDVFVIVGVYDEDESSFAMPNNGTGAPSAVDVTMVGNTLSGDIAENLKWNLSIGEDGYTFYPNGETESWLYCNNTNNGVHVGTNENNVFTMTPEGYLYNNATSRYIGIYNRQDWRCYTSINNNIKDQTFAFYKRVDEGSLVTYTLDIKGYESDTTGGWHLIASPVSMIRPTAENGFLTDEYDLYRFDQTNEKEWRNYKKNHFNLVSGHGYLYASQENTTLTFTGVPCTGNRKEVKVTYDENAVLAGFNLVGNPFTTEAILVDANGTALAYLKMNEDGNGFTAVDPGEPIAEMEAVFYQATPNDNSVYFSTEYRTAKSSHLNMTVNQGRGTVDNAIIRFGKGNTLEKFSFREGSTKVYIPQDGKDYAVVNVEGEGEMPISFQAENNGTYSLSFNTKNVEFGYLHLIDNLTGADIDLLATPSYSFEANTTDYASRFRLVFSTSNTDSDNFAFISNGQIIINGQGSTVQVYDVTGRMIGSHNNVNHIATEGMSAGVYMLRLVNGNDVKTQKIVVK